MIAKLSEGAYRLLLRRERPLFTRHVILTLARDQNYDVRRLTALLGDFPIIGVEEGLSRTVAWLNRRSSDA
jgi:nucleoside-diphosphate-sugar epimerase